MVLGIVKTALRRVECSDSALSTYLQPDKIRRLCDLYARNAGVNRWPPARAAVGFNYHCFANGRLKRLAPRCVMPAIGAFADTACVPRHVVKLASPRFSTELMAISAQPPRKGLEQIPNQCRV